LQAQPGSKARPQRHGFIAAISMKRWIRHAMIGAGDCELAILQRLAQRIQHVMRPEAERISKSYGVGTIEWPIQQDSWPALDLAVGAKKKRASRKKFLDRCKSTRLRTEHRWQPPQVDPEL
jgi:hypothetical protein